MNVQSNIEAYEKLKEDERKNKNFIEMIYPNTKQTNEKVSNTDDKALKYDKDKLRMELVPPEAIEALAAIYTMGAKKYGDNNWYQGMKWSRLIGAMLRHFYAWLKGEEKDPESGYSPLWHAFWNMCALIVYQERKLGTDDRVCSTIFKK